MTPPRLAPYRSREEKIAAARVELDEAERQVAASRGRYADGERSRYLAREAADAALERAAQVLRGER